jgi:flavin reductase (DIM6/NTAB) family NADH-FMN oxidoreductase RutF
MMTKRTALDFWAHVSEILYRFRHGGVLCTVADAQGETNLLTLGWGQIGPSYHGHPVLTIAVTPLRYSWRFLEQGDDFTIAVPDDSLREAVALCGRISGRDGDKFAAAGLTPVPGAEVHAPSVRECPLNIECRIYARVHPPHMLLTPEHRQRPLEHQHTIYFSEVLGAYGWG